MEDFTESIYPPAPPPPSSPPPQVGQHTGAYPPAPPPPGPQPPQVGQHTGTIHQVGDALGAWQTQEQAESLDDCARRIAAVKNVNSHRT